MGAPVEALAYQRGLGGLEIPYTVQIPRFRRRPPDIPTTHVEPVIFDLGERRWTSIEFKENDRLGLKGAKAVWGMEMPTRLLRGHLGTNDQGFDVVYGYPEIDERSREIWEIKAATRLIQTLLERSGVPADRIACYSLGCGTPIGPEYAEFLAYEAGIPTNRLILEANTACNSGARAFAKLYEWVEKYPELADEWVVVHAHEGMRRLIDWLDTSQGNPFALAIFTNGSAAVVFQPKNLRMIASETVEQEDEKGNLAATETYPILKQTEGGEKVPLVQYFGEDGRKERIVLPTPPNGMKINLQESPTAKMMLRFAGKNLERMRSHHAELISQGKIENKPLLIWFLHHASEPMAIGLRHMLKIDERVAPFLIRTGNASGATSTQALVEGIDLFGPGDRIVKSGFGAGMQMTTMILEGVGEGNRLDAA